LESAPLSCPGGGAAKASCPEADKAPDASCKDADSGNFSGACPEIGGTLEVSSPDAAGNVPVVSSPRVGKASGASWPDTETGDAPEASSEVDKAPEVDKVAEVDIAPEVDKACVVGVSGSCLQEAPATAPGADTGNVSEVRAPDASSAMPAERKTCSVLAAAIATVARAAVGLGFAATFALGLGGPLRLKITQSHHKGNGLNAFLSLIAGGAVLPNSSRSASSFSYALQARRYSIVVIDHIQIPI